MLSLVVTLSVVVSQSAPPLLPAEPLEVLPFPTSPPPEAPAAVTSRAVAPPPALPTEPRVERPTLDFGVGLRGFNRAFGTTNGSGAIPQWNGAAPGVMVSGGWFPGAFATSSLAGDLGLVAEGHFAVGMTTQFGSQLYATTATVLRGGLAMRFPTGRHQFFLGAGVESSTFTVSPTSVKGQARPDLPDVAWFGPRGTLGWAVALGETVSFSLKASGAYMLTGGPLQVTYPGEQAFGIDGSGVLSWSVVPNLSVRLHGDFSRVFIALDVRHPAAETTFGGGLGLAVHL